MLVREPITRLIQQLYAPEADELDWMEGIREAAVVALEGCSNVHVHTARVHGGEVTLGNVVGERASIETLRRLHELAPPQVLQALYRSGPITRASAAVETSDAKELLSTFERMRKTFRISDGFGVNGLDTDGRAVVLSFGFRASRLPARVRTTLTRLSGHLTTAYRLRGSTSRPAAVIDSKEGILTENTPLEAGSQRRLREAALAIDRARRASSFDPDAALGYWRAMVEGKWTLVERFEADGRRILVARPNEPKTQRSRKLTGNELKVVSLSALNHPAKLVAYELGFSESATSRLLSRALRKLGLKNRAELVELRDALFGTDSHDDPAGEEGTHPPSVDQREQLRAR